MTCLRRKSGFSLEMRRCTHISWHKQREFVQQLEQPVQCGMNECGFTVQGANDRVHTGKVEHGNVRRLQWTQRNKPGIPFRNLKANVEDLRVFFVFFFFFFFGLPKVLSTLLSMYQLKSSDQVTCWVNIDSMCNVLPRAHKTLFLRPKKNKSHAQKKLQQSAKS